MTTNPPTLFDPPDNGHGPERCPECGQRIRRLNPHRMDLGKWRMLRALEDKRRVGVTWVKVQRDGNLIHPDDAEWTIQADDVHALRLTWFGLAKRRRRRTGEYQITMNGRRFLAGRHAVPARIWCREGSVIRSDAMTVRVDQIKRIILDRAYWDRYRQIEGEEIK